MQYIQLQGQVASDLDSPLAGGFNLFIDTADGSIKAKDSEGNLTSTGGGLIETTYSEISASFVGGTLTPGAYYKITDFKTCYDQPDYGVGGNPITNDNYRTGSISPVIVFALDSGSIASDAYQPQYPNDNIKYDISFNQTEATYNPAFGRIIYRKDNQGNEMDYDFREVRFKRYNTYFSEEVYPGTISVVESGSFIFITGSETSFTNFTTGSVVGVLNVNNDPIVEYYEITSIEDDYLMFITGSRYSFPSETRLLDANELQGMSWKQNNIISNSGSVEVPTFNDITECFNNTSTNTAAYTIWDEYTFLLPNNVFKGESTYRDNSFSQGFRNNTFNGASCNSNRVMDRFYNNIIDNDFDNNIINDEFYDNIIDCDFQNNTISGEFYNNHFGNYDSVDFDYNTINGSFYNNFYTGENSFEYNIINGGFDNNIILGEFSKNTLKGFYNNVLEEIFSDNIVGEGFESNKTYDTFRENLIADEVYNNNFFSEFLGNTLTGDDVYDNNFYSYTEDNQIGTSFYNNIIGDAENIGNTNFRDNVIGNNFYDNTAMGDLQHNVIGNDFYDNLIGPNFSYNQIRNSFYSNTIGDDFGFGGGNHRGNIIGNNFNHNNIGEYFYDNNIGDNFEYNSVGNYFQFNRVETAIGYTDFTEYYGNLINISYPTTNGTDGVYTNITPTSTSGIGFDTMFDIIVSSDLVDTVTITNAGKLYEINDTITIPSGSFGGDTDLVLTVTDTSYRPEVYANYNKTVQRAADGNAVLIAILPGEGYYPYITPNITQAIY